MQYRLLLVKRSGGVCTKRTIFAANLTSFIALTFKGKLPISVRKVVPDLVLHYAIIRSELAIMQPALHVEGLTTQKLINWR